MKTSGWNKLPLWARYLGVLFGFPAVVGFSRAALEHRFGFTGDVILVIALVTVSILVFWNRKQSRAHVQAEEASITREDRQHEDREEQKLAFLIFAMFTIVLLTGTFFGFCIMFSATPQGYPWALYGVFRVFGAGIGFVCLLVTFICYQQAKFEFLWLKGLKPSHSVTVSGKTVLFVIAVILTVAFAIARVYHL